MIGCFEVVALFIVETINLLQADCGFDMLPLSKEIWV